MSLSTPSFARAVLSGKHGSLAKLLIFALGATLMDAVFLAGVRALALVLAEKNPLPDFLNFELPEGFVILLLWFGILATAAGLRSFFLFQKQWGSICRFLDFEKYWKTRLLKSTELAYTRSLRHSETSAMVHRFGYDFRTLEQGSEALITTLQALIQLLIFLPLLFFISWELALGVLLFAIPLVSWSQKVFFRLGSPISIAQKQRQNTQSFISALFELLPHWSHPKHRQDSTSVALKKLEKQYSCAKLAGGRKAGIHSLSELVATLSVIGIFSFSGWLVQNGDMEALDLLLFSACLVLIYRPVKECARLMPLYREAQIAWNRIQDADFRTKIHSRNFYGSDIQLKNVTFSWSGTDKIFDSLTLEIPAQSVTILSGPNGCGKSTLLRILAGFETIKSGTLRLPDSCREQGIAFLAQEPVIPPLSPKELFPVEKAYSRPEALREILGIHEILAKAGDSEDWGQQLSGGQRQRLALALVLELEAPLVLLDEPTSALPFRLRNDILQKIATWCREGGITLLMATHEDAEIPRAHHLNLGRIL